MPNVQIRSKYAWILGENGRKQMLGEPAEGPRSLKLSQVVTTNYFTITCYMAITMVFVLEVTGSRTFMLNKSMKYA